MARIFKTPFGAQGDTEQVPEAPQGDGSVSLTQGFGYDYEREYEDPAAKDIRREVMNGLFHDVTEAIGDIQLSGIAKWSADAAPYPAGAVVWHNSVAWLSTVGNNTTTPSEGASWTAVAQFNDSRITGAAQKSANLSDLSSAATARQNLELGTMATRDTGTGAGEHRNNQQNDSRFIRPDGNGNVGIDGLMSVGGSANHVLGAVLLDTVNLSGQVGTGTTLNIPTVFRGRLRKIVLEITAGISTTGSSTVPVVLRLNGDSSESYRSIATAYDVDNQSVGSAENIDTSFPRFGYLGTFHPSRLTINVTPGSLGSTSTHSWESRGWGHRGAAESQFLCQAGGRWRPESAQQLSSVTVRSATNADVWAAGGIAVLWGYPA